MKLSTIFSTFSVPALVIAAPTLQTRDDREVKVTIDNGGTGCPNDTPISWSWAGDALIVVLATSYTSQSGPGIAISDSRHNCQLSIQPKYGSKLRWRIKSQEYTGTLALASGAKATTKAIVYAQGKVDQTEDQTDFSGPKTREYKVSHDLSPYWSPCSPNAILSVNQQTRVDGTAKIQAGSGKQLVFKFDTEFQAC